LSFSLEITVKILLKRDGIALAREDYLRATPCAPPIATFFKKSRNFGHAVVFNLLMNNEPLQNAQRQLRELLSRLPDAPVASNFTARVLLAIEADEMHRSRWRIMDLNWRIFFPRITVTAAAAGIVAVVMYQHDISAQRQALGHDVYVVASQPMPSVEALKNFDAIQRMGQTARPDDELLALASDMQ
jgi:hypothetical protein